MKKIKNDLFLRACRKEETERTPIWIMRQAGRYLPEYREVRKKYDFLTMCKTPEVAAEVTIQPVDLIGVDAAILFSDILVIPEAMGMKLEIEEGRGPVFHEPVRDTSAVMKLKVIDPFTDLKYVLDSIKITLDQLNGRVPLIGFSGSPWTLMTYMVEGKGSKNFSIIKSFVYNQRELAHQLLDKISDAVIGYLNAKIETGVNAVQIFDTWGGILSPQEFREFSLPYIEKIVGSLKRTQQPVIVFCKGVHHSLKELSRCGAEVLGLDWTLDIGRVRKRVGSRVALQGNLDPTVLYGNEHTIREGVRSVLYSYGNYPGHIFNLGHGILPDIDPDNTRALVRIVKEESIALRNEKKEKKKSGSKHH